MIVNTHIELTEAQLRYLRALNDPNADLRKFNGHVWRHPRKKLIEYGLARRLPVAGNGAARVLITAAGIQLLKEKKLAGLRQ